MKNIIPGPRSGSKAGSVLAVMVLPNKYITKKEGKDMQMNGLS